MPQMMPLPWLMIILSFLLFISISMMTMKGYEKSIPLKPQLKKNLSSMTW